MYLEYPLHTASSTPPCGVPLSTPRGSPYSRISCLPVAPSGPSRHPHKRRSIAARELAEYSPRAHRVGHSRCLFPLWRKPARAAEWTARKQGTRVSGNGPKWEWNGCKRESKTARAARRRAALDLVGALQVTQLWSWRLPPASASRSHSCSSSSSSSSRPIESADSPAPPVPASPRRSSFGSCRPNPLARRVLSSACRRCVSRRRRRAQAHTQPPSGHSFQKHIHRSSNP
jgi:hypothetical protein